MGKKSLKDMVSEFGKELKQKRIECDKKGKHEPLIYKEMSTYTAIKCGYCEKYIGKKSKYSHKERMEIYERRHTPMTF